MKDLLKIISKNSLKGLNIFAADKEDTEGEEKAENAKETFENFEEDKDQEREIRKQIGEGRSSKVEEGSPIDQVDEDKLETDTIIKKRVKNIINDTQPDMDSTFFSNSDEGEYTGFNLPEEGEMERFHIRRLKALKERILNRLKGNEDIAEDDLDEGDTDE